LFFNQTKTKKTKMSIAQEVREIRKQVEQILQMQLLFSPWGRRIRMGQMNDFMRRTTDNVFRAAFPGANEQTEFDLDQLQSYIRGMSKPQIEQHFQVAWNGMRAPATRGRRAPVQRANSV
jgi:hypothetical protein